MTTVGCHVTVVVVSCVSCDRLTLPSLEILPRRTSPRFLKMLVMSIFLWITMKPILRRYVGIGIHYGRYNL